MSETRTYKIAGLACSDCAARIQTQVRALEGVRACEVDPGTGMLTVQLDPSEFDLDRVSRIVEETGHTLVVERTRSAASQERAVATFARFLLSRTETVLTTLAGGLTLMGLALSLFHVPELVTTAVFALAILLGGAPAFARPSTRGGARGC